MKDITIKASTIRRELYVLLAMLILAFLTNVYAIISYGGQWSELISQLHIVVALTIFYYIFVGIIRLIVAGIRKLIVRGSPEEPVV